VNFVIVAALAMVPAVVMANGPAVDLSPSQLMLKSHSTQLEWVLTVVGPDDFYHQQVFAKGETPSFKVSVKMPDGSYTYELSAQWQPDAAIAEVLAQARQTGDYSKVDKLRLEGRIPEPIEAVSGYFMLSSGSIIIAEEASEEIGKPRNQTVATAKDQVILDDLIVSGSICVGFDCVSGESFGFDTIRMKENNLRIRAYDTSNSASFPTNDWQITFNDSSNGGANKFSIDDIDGGRTPFTIEASAPSNSLYVDDGGRLGFGTATPVAQLHVKDGNTPTLRLEQDGSSGFTPQTWDVAGNEANFFIRDATNGSELPFRIIPGAPSNSLYITSGGNIGVGTTSPSSNGIHIVRTTAGSKEMLNLQNNGGMWITFDNTNSGDTWYFTHENVNEGDFIIDSAVGGGVDGPEFTLDVNGNLEIAGGLTTTGATCNSTPCDAVFHSNYDLPSLEEHAAFMWTNSYLPAIGPTPADQPMNISEKMAGVLNELETAHIYIEQLNTTVKSQQSLIEQQQNALEELSRRLEELEK
jgi:hypothetical protein